MDNRKFFLLVLFCCAVNAYAQLGVTISEMEKANKECLHIKSDSGYCSKLFHIQMDSMLNIVFEEVKTQTPTEKKASLMAEQLSWSKRKAEYFKKLDETFVYNMQEGIWKKDMIRITYQQKAEYVFKRIRLLLWRVSE